MSNEGEWDMEKKLMIFGGIFAVLIVAGVISFCVRFVKGTGLDAEGKAYVDKVTPIILANLNKETLFKYASEELKNAPFQDVLFDSFAKLGQFKEYKGSNGQTNVSVTTTKEKQITGVYQAEAEFETGPATINITTIKRGDDWQIIGFKISSTALAGE